LAGRTDAANRFKPHQLAGTWAENPRFLTRCENEKKKILPGVAKVQADNGLVPESLFLVTGGKLQYSPPVIFAYLVICQIIVLPVCLGGPTPARLSSRAVL